MISFYNLHSIKWIGYNVNVICNTSII